MYALTRQDVETSNNVVICTLLIDNVVVKVLFDLGVTHSFMFIKLAIKIGKPKKRLEHMLMVSTPLGKCYQQKMK